MNPADGSYKVLLVTKEALEDSTLDWKQQDPWEQ
jgi:hypothetical protein